MGVGDQGVQNTIKNYQNHPDLLVIFFGPFRPSVQLTNIEYIKAILKTSGRWCCKLRDLSRVPVFQCFVMLCIIILQKQTYSITEQNNKRTKHNRQTDLQQQ